MAGRGRWQRAHWLALGVLLVAAALRVHALGHDGLWFDEVGQLTAATQPTLGATLQAIRTHAMALPLDYAVTRAAALLTPDVVSARLLLRVPSLLWGTLALAALWALARRATGPWAALLALVMLSLWAQHVRYSQELRFYAALVFFSLFATLALLAALRRPRSLKRWAFAGLSLVIGSYFHAYVLLALLPAAAALLAQPPAGDERQQAWTGLGLTALAAGVLFAPGYWFFGAGQQFNYDLWEFGLSPARVLGQGLGWLAYDYSARVAPFGLWEALVLFGLALGLIAALAQPRRQALVLALAAAVVAQVGVIFAADVVKGYWFLARQLLAAAPLLFILAAFGYVAAAEALARRLGRPRLHAWLPAGTALLFVVGAVPNLTWYYTFPHTTTDAIAAILAERHQPGEPVYVLSVYEVAMYEFQLAHVAGGAAVLPDVHALTWADLPALPEGGPTYLALSARETAEHLALVQALGYRPLLAWEGDWTGAQSLYVREP